MQKIKSTQQSLTCDQFKVLTPATVVTCRHSLLMDSQLLDSLDCLIGVPSVSLIVIFLS
jgi:hypothetical protein